MSPPAVWQGRSKMEGNIIVMAHTNVISLAADLRAFSRWLPVKPGLNHGLHLSSQAEWRHPTTLTSISSSFCLGFLFHKPISLPLLLSLLPGNLPHDVLTN